MTTESLSVTIEGEVIAVEIGTVAVAPGGGSGDVVGPASSTDGAIAVFDGTSGKLLAEGPVTGAAVAAHMAASAGEHGITTYGANLISSNTQEEARNELGLGALSAVTPGTGIATALAVNVGSNGAPVIQGGALGTPSSGDLSNVSGLPPSGIANAGATLGQVITWNGTAWVPETPSGGGAGTKTFLVASPLNNQPPASAFATLDTRNSIPCLDFDAAADESAIFSGFAPEVIVLTSGIIARIVWAATSATSGNVRWRVKFERRTTDQDTDSWDTATEATDATNATSGNCEVCEITCTTIDSIVAGDSFRVCVTRVGTDGTNDTMTGDAELFGLELRAA